MVESMVAGQLKSTDYRHAYKLCSIHVWRLKHFMS